MRYSFMRLAAPALALLLGLTACSAGLAGSERSAAQQGADTHPPKKITIWNLLTLDERQAAIHESIMRFNAAQEEIQVVPYYFENEAYKNKLRVAMLSNNMPDIFYFWSGESFKYIVDSGMAADLTGILDAHPAVRNGIVPEALQAASYRGRIYGIPHSIQHILVWYSKPLFERFGLAEPDSWEELLEIADRLNEAGIAPVAVGGKDRWPLLHWYSYLAHRLGGAEPFRRTVAGEGDFTDPSFVEAAQLLRDFAERGAFMPGHLGMDQPAAEEAFLSGEAAMFLQGDWAAARMLDDERMRGDIGYFRFPQVRGEGDEKVYQGGYSVGWAVSSGADLESAFELLSFLMSPKERSHYVAISGTPSTATELDLSGERVSRDVERYLSFIDGDATDYFGFYDQDIEYQRAQELMNAIVTIVRNPGREDIAGMLKSIR